MQIWKTFRCLTTKGGSEKTHSAQSLSARLMASPGGKIVDFSVSKVNKANLARKVKNAA